MIDVTQCRLRHVAALPFRKLMPGMTLWGRVQFPARDHSRLTKIPRYGANNPGFPEAVAAFTEPAQRATGSSLGREPLSLPSFPGWRSAGQPRPFHPSVVEPERLGYPGPGQRPGVSGGDLPSYLFMLKPEWLQWAGEGFRSFDGLRVRRNKRERRALRIPRALPWAGLLQPVGLQSGGSRDVHNHKGASPCPYPHFPDGGRRVRRACSVFLLLSLKGSDTPAQGNALGGQCMPPLVSFLLLLLVQPNGLPYAGPGQRPGGSGRANPVLILLFLLLLCRLKGGDRPGGSFAPLGFRRRERKKEGGGARSAFPGRCPGLAYCSPSGCDTKKRTKMGDRRPKPQGDALGWPIAALQAAGKKLAKSR